MSVMRYIIEDILIDLRDNGMKLEINSEPNYTSVRITSAKNFGYSDVMYPIEHLINFMTSEGFKFSKNSHLNDLMESRDRTRTIEINFNRSVLSLLKAKGKNG